MDWAGLQAFVAVADHGGFSAAAAQLHLTQPAVSKRIALLEQSLDARLFDRIGRQVLLTEAGRLLLPRAQVPLDLRFMDSEQAWNEVLHGQSELALTTLGPAEAPLVATPVWDDPLRFVAAPDHPLARLRKVTLADLAAHPAVLPDADTFTHRIVAEAFAQRGLALQLRMTTNYMETIKMLASVGLAWSALPETMLDAQLQVLPVREAKLSRQLGSIVHGGRTLSRAARAFIELLNGDANP